MRQHDAAGVRGGHAAVGITRGSGIGNQKAARAPAHRGNGERGHERQTQPAAMGAGKPLSRDRDADLRLAFYQQLGRGRE